MADSILEITGIETCYGLSQVLFGVSLAVAPGEMVTLMGRNGMGKTTTVRSIMGLTAARAGTVRFMGEEIRGLPSYKVAQRGIGLVPEGRQIFPNLSVRENLLATAVKRNGEDWTLAKVYGLFPRLAERADSMGNQLSGGEQQMLAIGRALMVSPSLLLIDEPSLGLSPLVVDELERIIASIKESGVTVLMVEGNVDLIRDLPDTVHVLDHGSLVYSGTVSQIMNDADLSKTYFGM